MVSATVIVTGGAIAVLAVALIAYYSLTGKKVNGQAITSLDLSGTDSKGNTLYLSFANGAVNYDILTPVLSNGQQLLTRYNSNGPSRFDVALNSTTLKVIGQWENMISAETIYTNPTMTVDGNTITLTFNGKALNITIDPTTNAPTSFGAFAVNSFNAGAFASRPTANLADPTSDQVFDSPSIPLNLPTSSRRNLLKRDLANVVNPSIALKNCLNEVAWLAYKTAGSVDYTVYINTCPASAGSPGFAGAIYGSYPTVDPANPGLVLSGSGGFCLHESQTQTCSGVLGGKTVVGFQGTSMNGGQYQDLVYDLVIAGDNGATGYGDAKGYSDGQANYDYCTGHSLGGARAKYAGIKGRCGNVVTFAAPLINYGSTGTPITQYNRIDQVNNACTLCDSLSGWSTYMDVVPQVGYLFGDTDNVVYTKLGSANDLSWHPQSYYYNPHSCGWWGMFTCYDTQTEQCLAGLTSTITCHASSIGSMHVLGKGFPFSVADGY